MDRHPHFPSLLSAVIIVVALLFIEALLAQAFHRFGAHFDVGDPKYGGVITVLASGLVLSLAMAYKSLNYRDVFAPAPVAPWIALKIAPAVILVIGGALIVFGALSELVVQVFPMSEGEEEIFSRVVDGGLASFITLALVAPFVEELLFRGIFLRAFLQRYSPTRALWYAALLFATAHLNIYQFVFALPLGLFVGWLYIRSGSLWPSILTHALHNSSVFLFTREAATEVPADVTATTPLWLLVIALATLLAGLFIIHRAIPIKRSP